MSRLIKTLLLKQEDIDAKLELVEIFQHLFESGQSQHELEDLVVSCVMKSDAEARVTNFDRVRYYHLIAYLILNGDPGGIGRTFSTLSVIPILARSSGLALTTSWSGSFFKYIFLPLR